MKNLAYSTLLALSVSPGLAASFHDLDFEEYDVSTGLVPGWIFESPGNTGSGPISTMHLRYNGITPLSNPPDAEMAPGSNLIPRIPNPGNYTLWLAPFGDFAPWYMRQTGEIPADAKSLSFDLVGAPVSLRFNGTEIPLEFVSNNGLPSQGSDFADVSSFAGKTGTLEIKATGITSFPPPGYTFLDNFAFSSSPVPIIPEPCTLALSMVGAVLVAFHWRFRRDSR